MLVAVDALPVRDALMVDGSFRFTFAEPFTLVVTAVPVPSLLTTPMFLAVPQRAVVIAALPLKLVPLIALVVAKVVAVEALPANVAVIVFVLGTYFNPVSVFNAWLPLALSANKIYLDVAFEFSAEVETVAAFPVVL